jgi:hypothetical protein
MLGVTKWFVVFPASRGQPYECITRVSYSFSSLSLQT